MSEKTNKFSTWIKSGIKENFTATNIRKINSALATFLVNILASLGLLVIAGAMMFVNPLITVVVVSIWASFEGFLSVAIIALFGSKADKIEINPELMALFKKATDAPTDINLMELKDKLKGSIEETFVPAEDLEAFYETEVEKVEEVIELALPDEPEPDLVIEVIVEPEPEVVEELKPEPEPEVAKE